MEGREKENKMKKDNRDKKKLREKLDRLVSLILEVNDLTDSENRLKVYRIIARMYERKGYYFTAAIYYNLCDPKKSIEMWNKFGNFFGFEFGDKFNEEWKKEW